MTLILTTPHFFENFFRGPVGTVPVARMPNFKSVILVVLELLTFNGQKFRGVTDPGHAP